MFWKRFTKKEECEKWKKEREGKFNIERESCLEMKPGVKDIVVFYTMKKQQEKKS